LSGGVVFQKTFCISKWRCISKNQMIQKANDPNDPKNQMIQMIQKIK
jgi:hypothetical protein